MNRQTILLGSLALVLVAALWWLFLYSPGQERLAQVETEIAAAETEQISLQGRLAALEAVRARAPETEAAIAQLRSIVPDDPALPAALRQIAAAANDAGFDIESITTTRPTVVDEAIGLYAVDVSLTGQGSYFQLVDLLRRLEDPAITARGIVMRDLSVAPAEYPSLTVSVSGQMYAVLDPPPTPEAEAPAEPAPAATAEDGAVDTEASE